MSAKAQERTRLPDPTVEFSVGPAKDGVIADYRSIHDAVEAAPPSGAIIRIRSGIYREIVHVDKPNIQLRGDTTDPSQVLLVFANGAVNTCGTSCSATLFVTGNDFYAENLTVANDWGKSGRPRTQAVALSITGDRAVLRNVRLLGEQDTLYAASKKCPPNRPCLASRQFFRDCYIEGEVDFIFGNAKAVFQNCEIRSIPHPGGSYVTAQSRLAGEDSGFVFDHCRLTATPGAGRVYLGRPWRDHATVVYLNSTLGPHISPEGWSEWHPGETNRLPTTTYAEYDSTGPGANPAAREPHSHQLTPVQAAAYEPRAFLRSSDNWNPETIR